MSSKLLIEEPPLQVLPSLAVKIGLNEAIFIQQLHYRLQSSNHFHDGKKWIYDTYEEWQKKLPFWSSPTVKRIVSSLRDRGLIETTNEYNKMKIDNTLWYSINYPAVRAIENQPVIRPSDQYDPTAVSNWDGGSDQYDLANNPKNSLRIPTKESEGQQPAPALLNSQQQLPTATAQQPATPTVTVKAAQPLTPSSAAPLSPSASSGQAPAWQPLLSEVMTKRDIAAAERDRVEAALNGSADLSRRNRPTFRSPHVKAALNAAGYVAPGAGVTPVEIYYERFSAYQPDERLSAPQEYDLMTLAGNAGVRPAIEAYGQTGYRAKNVKLIIEWTFDPSKYAQRGSSNGNTSVSSKQKQNVQIEQSAPVRPMGSIFRDPEPGEYN